MNYREMLDALMANPRSIAVRPHWKQPQYIGVCVDWRGPLVTQGYKNGRLPFVYLVSKALHVSTNCEVVVSAGWSPSLEDALADNWHVMHTPPPPSTQEYGEELKKYSSLSRVDPDH